MIVEQRWRILSAVSVGTFMATLDGSIVNISLPSIGRAFAIDLVAVQWVVVAYLLVVGATLLPFGRLGEVLTFRRVYLAGFALFTVASVLCGAAPGPLVLVAFRALQGVGAGMLQAMGPAIVARTFPAGERGRALGINAISVSVGLSLGPALGGLLTEFGTWRAIFLVNLPVGIFALLWAARVLPTEDRTGRTGFDVQGAALGSAALFAILLALSEGQDWGWSSPAVLGLLAGAVLLGAGFLVTERRALLPMIDLALFRIRAFSAGLAAVVLAFGALFTATFLLPFLLENGAGFTPLETGFLLTPVPIATAIVAPLSGAFSDRHGSRLPASVGLLLMAGGLLALGALPDPFSVPDLVWRLIIVGIGQGLFISPNSNAVLGAVPGARLGTASGTIAQMRILGQTLGIALGGAIVAVRTLAHLDGSGPAATAMAQGEAIRDALLVGAAICVVGAATSAVRGAGGPTGAPASELGMTSGGG